MPKKGIDYSNAIIYKITCKDKNIPLTYVGNTTNFYQKKHLHKQNLLNNITDKQHGKLYETIKANGEWNNWNMEIIDTYNCADHDEVIKYKQIHIKTLNATLNTIQKKNIKINGVKHDISETLAVLPSKKPADAIQVTEKSPKSPTKFFCELCDYGCDKKNDWDKHLLTDKHTCYKVGYTCYTKVAKAELVCENCDKPYNSRMGLWRHKKTCKVEKKEEVEKNEENFEGNIILSINENENDSNVDFKHLILEVVKSNAELQKQNTDLQKQVLELCKNGIANNNHINSHNKTFNLQFFLNEQCKDAMNISDFANTVDLQLSDLESVGELGYVEGITKIILDKLNSMDIYKRPIHCSDAKREILYVKDENVWAKEERNNPKLRSVIKTISFRNMKQVKKWSDTYPESLNNESRLNDKYMMLVIQSTGGNGEILDSENKIIRRITKEIVINKSLL